MGNCQSSLRWMFNVVATIIKSSLRYAGSFVDTVCNSLQAVQLRVKSFLRWTFNIATTFVKSALCGIGNLYQRFCDLFKYLHRRTSHFQGPYSILQISLDKLPNATVSLDNRATACRFRLVDCDVFLDSRILSVIEYPSFPPNVTYAAISYPWRDLQMPQGLTPPEGSFRVHGAESADEISIDVLRTACIAARRYGASLLWLDRLCLWQTCKVDKNWQIQNMFHIYRLCNPCLVFPGGLVRLARLYERTTWTDRAWTLQESAANINRDTVKCVFSFTYNSYTELMQELPNPGYSRDFYDFLCQGISHDTLEPGYSATCELLKFIATQHFAMDLFEKNDPMLSQNPDNFPWKMIPLPAAKLLMRALGGNGFINYQLLWMSAFSRTSSFPVDMIFSVMGPMGVDLPVDQFQKDDRLKATIKLIQALMERGRKADWLFIAPELPPSKELSTLPTFPKTSVSGRAVIELPSGLILPAFEAVGSKTAWKPDNAPKGVMSDSGYFTFRAKAAKVIGRGKDVKPSKFNAYLDATAEIFLVEGTWAVVVGRRLEGNRDPETGEITAWDYDKPFPRIYELTLLFIEWHRADNGQDLYHKVGMEHEIDEKKTSGWEWIEREFSIGGPGKGDRGSLLHPKDLSTVELMCYYHNVTYHLHSPF